MQYEVENKFPVESLQAVAADLEALGIEFADTIDQSDTYFAHPVRDFAVTDEAFRIRRSGDQNRVTYKGPRIDTTTKTRLELELPLADGNDRFRQYMELFEVLGFRPVSEVKKRRQTGCLRWEDADLEASLDDVHGLGCFVELEIVTDKEGLNQAKSRIARLATRLGLGKPVLQSYLQMLLDLESG